MPTVPDFKTFAAQQLADKMADYNEIMSETTGTDGVTKITIITHIYALENLFDKAGADIDMPMIGDFYDKLTIDGVDYPITKNDNVKRAIAAHTNQPIRTDFRIAVSEPSGKTCIQPPKQPACYKSKDDAFRVAMDAAARTGAAWNKCNTGSLFSLHDNFKTDRDHIEICHDDEHGNKVIDAVYHIYPVVVNEKLVTTKYNAPAHYISVYNYRGYAVTGNENGTRFTVMTNDIMTRGTLHNALRAIEEHLD